MSSDYPPGNTGQRLQYPIIYQTNFRGALGGDPSKPEFFDLCVARDRNLTRWYTSSGLQDRADIVLHTRNGNLPNPPLFYAEIVKRMKFMNEIPIRRWFYEHARGTPEQRTGPYSNRCPLCSSNWFGFPVADHGFKECPLHKVQDPKDIQKFFFCNTIATCPDCGGRSHRHTHCGIVHTCNRCKQQGHQQQYFICDDNLSREELEDLVYRIRRAHYEHIASLISEKKLGFPLVNDYPDQRFVPDTRSKTRYFGIGPYRDQNGEYPPIPIEAYTTPIKYKGLQPADGESKNFLCLYRLTEGPKEFAEWERKFRIAGTGHIATGQEQRGLIARPSQVGEAKDTSGPSTSGQRSRSASRSASTYSSISQDTQQDGTDNALTALSASNLHTENKVVVNGPEVIRPNETPILSQGSPRPNHPQPLNPDRARIGDQANTWNPIPDLEEIKLNTGTMLAELALREYTTNRMDGQPGKREGHRVGCPVEVIFTVADVPLPDTKPEVIERIKTWQTLLTTRCDWHPAAFEDFTRSECIKYMKSLIGYAKAWSANRMVFGFKLVGESIAQLVQCLEYEQVKGIPSISVYVDGADTCMTQWFPRAHERFQDNEPAAFHSRWFSAVVPSAENVDLQVELNNEYGVQGWLSEQRYSAASEQVLSRHATGVLQGLLDKPLPLLVKPIILRICLFQRCLVGRIHGTDPSEIRDWEVMNNDQPMYYRYLSLLHAAMKFLVELHGAGGQVRVMMVETSADVITLTRLGGILALPDFQLFQSESLYMWQTTAQNDWQALLNSKLPANR